MKVEKLLTLTPEQSDLLNLAATLKGYTEDQKNRERYLHWCNLPLHKPTWGTWKRLVSQYGQEQAWNVWSQEVEA